MQLRPRRLRSSPLVRELSSEISLNRTKLIFPLFVSEGKGINKRHPLIRGIWTVSLDQLPRALESLQRKNLCKILVFGVVSQRDAKGTGALNPKGPVAQALRLIRKSFNDFWVATDIALDPYTSHGHDGLFEGERILNDPTLEVLREMSLLHAQCGVDMVAPSDMMDGRVAAIREALDAHRFTDVAILSYTAKYASCLYGPFRDVLKAKVKGDKKTYQMNPANRREALRELELDLHEGADMVMVKPASWYLDIISDFKSSSNVPVVAYQVSGEAAMVELMVREKLCDRQRAIDESLVSIFRAGADSIVTYFAEEL